MHSEAAMKHYNETVMAFYSNRLWHKIHHYKAISVFSNISITIFSF